MKKIHRREDWKIKMEITRTADSTSMRKPEPAALVEGLTWGSLNKKQWKANKFFYSSSTCTLHTNTCIRRWSADTTAEASGTVETRIKWETIGVGGHGRSVNSSREHSLFNVFWFFHRVNSLISIMRVNKLLLFNLFIFDFPFYSLLSWLYRICF